MHRRELDGTLSFIGEVRDSAIATSSVSVKHDERFPGTTYDQTLNRCCGVWTVKAKHAWLADALTKVAAVMKPEQRSHTFARLGAEMVYGLSL
jgi:thiamine biosynthesis lipoprotein ApbE